MSHISQISTLGFKTVVTFVIRSGFVVMHGTMSVMLVYL